jgi:uncharacterized protein YlxW (UPF0749 family)
VIDRRSSVPLAAVLGLLGFLLVIAASSAQTAKRAAAPRQAELIRLIETRRTQVGDLAAAVDQLRRQVDAEQQLVAGASRSSRDQANQDALLADEAGTTAVRGRAVAVRLSDSARQPAPSEDAGAYRIHDTDVQLIVNALLAAGAEAVAVNDNRIVATSPIRAAGSTIVVNFRPLLPPYQIVAIGAGRDAFDQSEIARRFRRWTTQFGLGYNVSEETATLPAYTGRVSITEAQPANQPSGGATGSTGQTTVPPSGVPFTVGPSTVPRPTQGH